MISDDAINAATTLSSRYVSDRFLPDKAIDLIDEASSRVRMYKSPAAKKTKKIMAELREVRKEYDEAVAEDRDDDALVLLDRKGKLEKDLEHYRTAWDRDSSPLVGVDDIAEVVAMWTGVPVMQMAQAESERLLQMEDELNKAIIGQSQAIQAISKAVRRGRAGLKDPHRPIGTFFFLGPTGVGKTELTKALATFLFGSEDALIQLDMSEFQERHSVSRLVGAPPGYIGYDEAGQLTEAIRRRPYSIIVFDEIEKAHPDSYNMLLQIMEEGKLSDAKGHKVDFSNAIIVMTSNIGATTINQSVIGYQLQRDEKLEERIAYQEMRRELTKALKKEFRPEFINRLDDVIVFRGLNKDDIIQIVSLELEKVSDRLVEHEISLSVTPEAIGLIADLGYNPEMGARPLRRIIQQKIEDPLSDALLAGEFKAGDTIVIDMEMLEDEAEIILRHDDVPQSEAKEIIAAV
jgi:ATP-dependent Clp protease ATP-binding subunit ClpC